MPAEAVRRVLMTTDAVGGVWDYSLQLAEELHARGIEVTLATMGPRPTDEQRADAREIPSLTLIESDYRLEWTDDPWDDVSRAGSWLLDLESRVEPDIVHVNGYAHGALPWRAQAVVVAHSCVCSWWTAVRGREAPREWDVYRRRVRAGLESAAIVIAPSAAMLRSLAAHYGPVEGVVVPNGRDARRFVTGPKEPLVLSAGRLWDEAKNMAALVAIASELPWPIALAGDAAVDRGEAPGRVQYLGRLPWLALRDWMGRATIYALPARYEPFGLSILEAALSACALVLGDIPSLREHWDGAAVFVPPEHPRGLVAAIRHLTDDPARCAELGRRARSRGCELTSERMTDGYCRVYDALVARSQSVATRA